MARTASGNQTVDVGISGKAFILFSVNASGNTLAYKDGCRFSIGFAEVMSSGLSVITQRAVGISAIDNIGTSVTSRTITESGCLVFPGSSGGSPLQRRGHINQVSGTAIQIDWHHISGAHSGYVYVETFGGDDLVNAKVLSPTALSGHGIQSVSGFGFSGNFVIMVQSDDTGFAVNDGLGTARYQIGMATSSTEEIAVYNMIENASANADTWQWVRTDRFYLGSSNAGTATQQAEFNGFTANGFNLNWISGATGPVLMNSLVMKISGNVKVGSFIFQSGTGSMSTSGVGFSGKHVMLFSQGTSTNNVAVTSAFSRLSIGAGTDSSNRAALFAASEDGPTTMADVQTSDQTSVLVSADENATAASTVTRIDMDLTSFHADGITFDRTTGSISGEYWSGTSILYSVIGEIPAAPSEGEVIQPKSFVMGPSQFDNYRQGFGEGGFQPGNLPPLFGPMRMDVSGVLL